MVRHRAVRTSPIDILASTFSGLYATGNAVFENCKDRKYSLTHTIHGDSHQGSRFGLCEAFAFLKGLGGTRKMAQGVKMLVAKADYLNLTPRTCRLEKENQLLQAVL